MNRAQRMWQSHQTVRQTSLFRTLQDTAEEKHGEEKRVSTKVILEKKKALICILGVININFKYVNNIYWGQPHCRDLWYLMFLFLMEKKL